MAKVNAYLTFNGDCEKAFQFYKGVFGGEFLVVSKFKDMPSMPGHELPKEMNEKILHVSLPISKETVLMGSDANPRMGTVSIGQNISLSVLTDSKEEANKIFGGLAAGGEITMPIQDMFWGSYFGMLVDPFSNVWLVSYEYPKKDA